MTNPTLERAARALYEFGMMADCPTWEKFDQKYKEDFFDMARTVLMAVREPGKDVIHTMDEHALQPSEWIWEAAIVAILNDGEGE